VDVEGPSPSTTFFEEASLAGGECMNPKVDGYLRKNKKWADELKELRRIILDCPLTEEIKWRTPCYTFQDSNVVMIGAFKESAALSFMKGALLKDARGILDKPGQNTQSPGRQRAYLLYFSAAKQSKTRESRVEKCEE
jgi:uncharacterized protein YdeI (YjbR/CyaY-like superfamily)